MRKLFFVLIMLITVAQLWSISTVFEDGYKVFKQEEIEFYIGNMPMLNVERPDFQQIATSDWKSLATFDNSSLPENIKIWFKVDLSGVLTPFNAIYFNSTRNNLKVYYPSLVFPTKENKSKMSNHDLSGRINKQIIDLSENMSPRLFHSTQLLFSIETGKDRAPLEFLPLIIGSGDHLKGYVLNQEIKKTYADYLTFFIGNFMLFVGFLSLLLFIITIKRLNFNLCLFSLLMIITGTLYWLLSPLSLLFSDFTHTRMLLIIVCYYLIWIVFGTLIALFLKKKRMLIAPLLITLALIYNYFFPENIVAIRYFNISVLTLFNLSIIYQLYKSKLDLLSTKFIFIIAAIVNIGFLISHLFREFIIAESLFGPAGIGLIAWMVAFGYYSHKHYNRTIHELQLAKIENLEIKNSNLEAQVDSLKKQLNPDNLVRGFDTLVTLIETDKASAVEYTKVFITAYSYVFTTKHKDFVTVKDEIDFCKSFIFLLKKRVKNSVEVELSIEKEALTKLIPPLSIEMLLENAITHNIATEKNPLKIKIYTEDNYLVVENNLQLREDVKSSSKFGLKNLNQRLYLLRKRNIVVMENEARFLTKVPMVEN